MTDRHLAKARNHLVSAIVAGLLYFGFVFAMGVVFGALRVPLIEPQFGKLVATLIEAPLLVIVMILAARLLSV